MISLLDNLAPLLLEHSQCSVCDNLNWLMLSNGAADLNDNVIFFGFEEKQNEPSFVAKVPRLPSNARGVQIEYENLVEIWKRLGDDAVQYVPRPIAIFNAGRQRVLVISYVRGKGLLYSAKSNLWHNPQRVLTLLQEAACALRNMHDKVSLPKDNKGSVFSDFQKKADAFSQLYILTEKEQQALAELKCQLENGSGTHLTMIQGDFWHGNIIRSTVFRTLVFVDWQYSHWSQDVSLDVYMLVLAGALAGFYGSAENRARLAMKVLYQWRSKIIPAYLEAYGVSERFSLLPAKYGMLLCCVEKAVRSVLNYGYKQSDDLTWRILYSEIISVSESGFFDGI